MTTMSSASDERGVAVWIAESCGWLLDVDAAIVSKFLGQTSIAAENADALTARVTDDREPLSGLRRRELVSQVEGNVELSKFFYRSLDELVERSAETEEVLGRLIAYLESSPQAQKSTPQGIRFVTTSDVEDENESLPDLRLAYVILPEQRRIVLLSVHARGVKSSDLATSGVREIPDRAKPRNRS
jgi:hypothetical protein